MRAIAYIRVSSEEQARGLSLNTQRDACIAHIASKDWETLEIASDTVSGKSLKRRSGLLRALELLEAGEADALVVARLDRLSRSALDFYDLLARADRHGWVLVCLSPLVDMSDPYGRMVAGVAAAFAQFERELISQRQLESVAARRAAGTYKPPRPPVSEEAVRRILRLRDDGMSSEKIAERLSLEGIAPAYGDVWHGRTVRKVIARRTA